ncbi:MAG: tetratricopeptide repeat protein, partial [Caldilineaceae bacterium]
QRQQRFHEARVHLQAAQRTHAAIDNRHGVTMALINLGIVHEMLGELSAAHNAFQDVLKELVNLPDRYQFSLVNYSLGVLLSRLGDYVDAHRHLMTALETDRAIGDRGGQAWAHSALGLLYNHTGDYKTALAYHQRALQLAQEQGARTIEGVARLGIGRDYAGLGQWAQAEDAYTAALSVQMAQQQWVRVQETRGGLAFALLAQDRGDEAMAQVEQILDYLVTGALAGAREPALVYWHCYQVLHAHEDSRAPEILATATALIQTNAAKIDDPRHRHTYLHSEPTHRRVLNA